MSSDHTSKDYVFRRNESGELEFVGDFENFYLNDDNPWGQNGEDDRMGEYYKFSRERLASTIKTLSSIYSYRSLLEVGCGLGCVLAYLKKALPDNIDLNGLDISSTAIQKAMKNCPDLNFFTGDITQGLDSKQGPFDIIIFSQMLWYILDDLDAAFYHAAEKLNSNGCVIIINAFLNEQNYGKSIIDGFDGLIKYSTSLSNIFRIVHADIDYSGNLIHNDGILVMQKRQDFFSRV